MSDQNLKVEKNKEVIIEIRNGTAYVLVCPKGITVRIKDYDVDEITKYTKKDSLGVHNEYLIEYDKALSI